MKALVINNSINLIKSYYPNYDDTKLEEIKYGLLSLYLTLSKVIIISIISVLLGLFKEFIIFSLFYNWIRSTSFGLHATKSWICLISSTFMFIGIPIIAMSITIPINIVIIIDIINIILIYKNSPADTEKRPIINKNRRYKLKIISTITATIMAILSIVVNSIFISNILVLSLIIQNFLISPFAYKLFGLKYDNYKDYIN